MVGVRISRQGAEVLANAGDVASVGRIDAEVAGRATEAADVGVRVSRQAIEVLGKLATIGLTRLDAEVAGRATQAAAGFARISRQAIEVLAGVSPTATVTRLDAEVAGRATQASTDDVRVSRQAIEALARRGSAGVVSPLALAPGLDVFMHNWVTEAVMRSAYQTDIATSPTSGAESRRGLAFKPERTMTLVWEEGGDRVMGARMNLERLDRLLVTLRRLGDEQLAIPIVMDQRELDQAYGLADTTIFFDTANGRWFLGGRVVIIQLDASGRYASHSFHLIADLEDDRIELTAGLGVNVASGSLIFPMMDCEKLLEVRATHSRDGHARVELELAEIPGASQLPPTKADLPTGAQTFAGMPIWDIDPDWRGGVAVGRSRQGQEYRQGRGRRVFVSAERSRQTHELTILSRRPGCGAGFDDGWRAVEFFDTRRGRLRPFWLIDLESAWTPSSIDAGGTFMGVTPIGVFADFEAELEGEWAGLVMADGTVYVREAVTVDDVVTQYRITMSPVLPGGLNVGQAVRMGRARKVRFESDEMEERWVHTGLVSTTLRFVEVLEEKDVEVI